MKGDVARGLRWSYGLGGLEVQVKELRRRRDTGIIDDIVELRSSERLSALADTGMMDSSPEEVYDRLTSFACESLQCPISLLTFVSDDRQFFKSFHGISGELAEKRGTSISESICKYVVAKGTRLVICDTRKNLLTRRTAPAGSQGFGAYAGFPIFSLDKLALGAFCVIDSEPRFWTIKELSQLKSLSLKVNEYVNLAEESNRGSFTRA